MSESEVEDNVPSEDGSQVDDSAASSDDDDAGMDVDGAAGPSSAAVWAAEAGDAAALAAEAELERQLRAVDTGIDVKAVDDAETKVETEAATSAYHRQAAAQASKALGPPKHRGRPKRPVDPLPQPHIRRGEIMLKRGMLRDMNVGQDLVGTGLVEIVKDKHGQYVVRLQSLDIPNPDHHQLVCTWGRIVRFWLCVVQAVWSEWDAVRLDLPYEGFAVVCWYESYHYGILVTRNLLKKGEIQGFDDGMNGWVRMCSHQECSPPLFFCVCV